MIVIGLDIMLAALLIGALALGWRLNGRLKALRASQLDFARAVTELDAAAARAEAGLAALRQASDEAHDSLLARIDTARALAARLEKAEGSAESAARRAEAAAAELKAAPAPPALDALRPLRPMREAPARADAGDPAPLRQPSAPARRRPIADEQLFADADPVVRPGLQGLMRMSLSRRGV
jgi:hypothetical protein